jgi:glycogen operon protein
MPEFASRLTGSSDLYESSGRRPIASINFVTAHDGFTLRDLVSYNEKHNDANGEGNADGESHNRSWNCGVEGPTRRVAVNRLRARQQRNFLTTLFLSQGVPMLLHGDEMGRTQSGNNNVYCQDNEISWIDWRPSKDAAHLIDFTERVTQLRHENPVFRRRRFFQGHDLRGVREHEIAWFRPDGAQMDEADWTNGYARTLGVFLNGDAIDETGPRGEPVEGDSFLLLMNAHSETVEFTLPGKPFGTSWRMELDTAAPSGAPLGAEDEPPVLKAGEVVRLLEHGMVVLRRV